MQWFRWYHGSCADPKFGRVARRSGQTRERVVFVWMMILESASDAEQRGNFSVEADDIADTLNCDTADIEAVIAAFADAGMIAKGSVTAWEKRQPSRDSSANRMRQKRERDAPVTRCDANSDAVVTPPDTETELDSVPIGTGDLVAVPDLRKSIFDDCLPWLAKASGRGEGPLRGMLGKWCRDHSDETVLTTIRACMRSPPVNPVAWIERNLNGGHGAKRNQPPSEIERSANLARLYDEAHSHGVG